MNHRLRDIVLLLLVETVFFGLIFLFLFFEEAISIFSVILGTLLLSYLVKRFESVNAFLQVLFNRYRILAVLWGLFFALSLPVLFHKSPYVVHILFIAGLYAILAIGLDFQVGSTYLLNFATAADYAIGAYTAALLSVHYGWSFWMVLPLAGLAAALFGFILGLPSMRTRTHHLALVTLAVGLIIYICLNNFSWTGGANGVPGIPLPAIGGFSFGSSLRFLGIELPFQANFYYLVLIVVIIEFIVARRLYRSKIGLAWNAIRDDEIAAQCQGIDIIHFKIMAFYTNAFFDGLAGAIYAFNVGYISPENFTFWISVIVVTMVIVGGMGNTTGVIFAAMLMTLLPEKFQAVTTYRIWVFALVILIMLLTRPKGLFPQKIRQYG